MAHGANPNRRTEGRLILVVDDFPETIDLLATILAHHGYYVSLAMNGPEGIRLAHEQQPDLIVMDFAMPRMNGLEATRLLKADDATRRIPVILYTAHAGTEVEIEAQRAGCAAVAVKPIETERLFDLVERALAPP